MPKTQGYCSACRPDEKGLKHDYFGAIIRDRELAILYTDRGAERPDQGGPMTGAEWIALAIGVAIMAVIGVTFWRMSTH